jgi:hypothetical protein
MCARAR